MSRLFVLLWLLAMASLFAPELFQYPDQVQMNAHRK